MRKADYKLTNTGVEPLRMEHNKTKHFCKVGEEIIVTDLREEYNN